MSDEGSSHLGPDEAIKRQNAELLQADLADLVFFLLPGPPSLPGIVCDSIMALATEALEHAGQRKERRPADEAVPIYEFKRLVDLAFEDTQLQADLNDAMLSVEAAARQLAGAQPNTEAWRLANWVLAQAISQLVAASARLMRLDADTQAARIHESRQEPAGIPVIDVLTAGEPSDPFPSAFDLVTAPGQLSTSAMVVPDAPTIEAAQQLEELVETRESQNPSQIGIAPGPPY